MRTPKVGPPPEIARCRCGQGLTSNYAAKRHVEICPQAKRAPHPQSNSERVR